jgi:hypothetical protein
MSDKLKRALKRTNFDELNEKGYVKIEGKPEQPQHDYFRIKEGPAPIDKGYTKVPGKSGKFGGKLGALAAAATLGYQALKGDKVMAQDVIKSGAELLNPLPFSMDEMKSEVDKMDSKKKLDQLMADKELERKIREDKARPGALEFGKYLKKMK